MRIAVLTEAPFNPTCLEDRATEIDQDADLIPAERVRRDDAGAAFVRMRLRLQQQIGDLKEALEQGLALDMAIAAENLERAANALAAELRALFARPTTTELQIQAALYEHQAIHDTIVDLFEVCLRLAPPSQSNRILDISPVDRYPWLREHLTSCAARTDHALAMYGCMSSIEHNDGRARTTTREPR